MTMQRKPKVRLIIVAGIILALGVGLEELYRWGYIGAVEKPATLDQIRAEIPRLKQSKVYTDGGVYLAELERPGTVIDPAVLDQDLYRSYSVRHKILTDFAGSFTQEQIQTMRDKGGVPYTSLSPDQKRLASLIYKTSAYQAMEKADVPQSTFNFMRDRRGGSVHMNWTVVKNGVKVGDVYYGLAISSGITPEFAEAVKKAKPHKIHP